MYFELCFPIFETLGSKHFSTNIDKFSTAVPHPLMMTLMGLSTLCVLIKPYIFRGAATDGSVNLLQLLSKTFFSVHF